MDIIIMSQTIALVSLRNKLDSPVQGGWKCEEYFLYRFLGKRNRLKNRGKNRGITVGTPRGMQWKE